MPHRRTLDIVLKALSLHSLHSRWKIWILGLTENFHTKLMKNIFSGNFEFETDVTPGSYRWSEQTLQDSTRPCLKDLKMSLLLLQAISSKVKNVKFKYVANELEKISYFWWKYSIKYHGYYILSSTFIVAELRTILEMEISIISRRAEARWLLRRL